MYFFSEAKWCHFTFTNVELGFFQSPVKENRKCPPQHSEREQTLETAHVEAESTLPII